MKRTLILLLPVLMALASCGTTAQYASNQQYPDGIYYRPQPVVELYSEDDFKEMAARNLSEKRQADSLMLADDDLRLSYYYNPYYYGPYYGYRGYAWSPYWYMGSLSFNPWVSFWTDPWFDPYWGPSWYYGGWGYYDYYSPYYYRPYHYSYGGYGGYHGFSHSGFARSGTANPDNNYRRSGNLNTVTGGVPAANFKRSGGMTGMRSSGSTASGSVRGSTSSDYSRRSNYSRSSIDFSPRVGSESSSRSSSGSSTRSSGSSYSGSSSRSSGGSYSSGGSSYSSGGGGGSYSGGSSHSGGSGGGGGGRR